MINNWSSGSGVNGANNRARSGSLPEGFVRDLLNLIPAGGGLSLRPGYEKVLSGTRIAGAVPFSGGLLVCDGGEVVALSPSGGATPVGTVEDTGIFVGDSMDGATYVSTGVANYVYSLGELRPLGVQEATAPPAMSGPATSVRVAVTFVDRRGVEGGCITGHTLHGGHVTVSRVPEGCRANVYATEPDGGVYYLQQTVDAGVPVSLNSIRADTAPLNVMGYRRPPPATAVACSSGMLFLASGRYVFHTEPMRPTLVDPVRGFFQYPTTVNGVVSGLGGVYVLADKCYILTGVGTEEVRQSVVSEHPPVAGTGGVTRDGRAYWMTRYGLAMEQIDPRGPYVSQLGEAAFTPRAANRGYSGVVEVNGEQVVVSGLKAPAESNPLAASGYFEAEVERP